MALNDLELALALADEADAITSRYFAQGLKATIKTDRSLVTQADIEAEARMADMLRKHRPRDDIAAEELHHKELGDGRVWAIDPIDHTNNYARGLPLYGTLISLLEDRQPIVGVVSAPALKRRWWAARGVGAFADGERIHVSQVADLEDAHLSFSQLEAWLKLGMLDGLVDLVSTVRWTFGSGGIFAQMWVAEGRIDISLDSTGYVWDLAASQIIVEEAGGRFTDVSGISDPGLGTGIATNGTLHLSVLGRLSDQRGR
ncbi:inositol monophosphatase family protein [Micromonospora sp. NPDC005710]|uniref:inositol monophosphatase family protein n=1 Tax=Micromonospora sp. NPDC005710 TaxID=3157051 RepID=UPI0033C1E72D